MVHRLSFFETTTGHFCREVDMDALVHGQGSSSLMHEGAPGGASPASDDIWFVPDDTYYIGYDQTGGVCGRPRQINVTRRIDLGGTSNDYEPVLNLLSSGSCTVPVIDAFFRGLFYSNLTGVTTPVELWADNPYPILIHSDKTLVSLTPREGAVILAGYEAVADGESEFDRLVEVGLENGDGSNIDVTQYFGGNRQLIATARGEISPSELIGYGLVPSSDYHVLTPTLVRAGLEARDDGALNPAIVTLWGKRQNAAYDGISAGVNAMVVADVNNLTLNLDHLVNLFKWRDNSDDEFDLYRFKRDQMEIVDGDVAYLLGTDTDGAAAVGARVGSDESFTTAGSRLVEFINNTALRGYIDHAGDFAFGIGDHDDQVMFGKVEVSQVIAAAATTIAAIQIPAGAICYAVSTYVVVTIPGAATYSVGVGGAATRYGTLLSGVAGNSNVGTDDAFRYYLNNTNILITPVGVPGAATGVLRIVVRYVIVDPPTS